ncbi:MAG TPA: BrnA antitoxin family protein [Eoetvoesiella sp.]|uniref:BrnA antitoxin family protein n=1 Tax=Eoetvoesiella sp. TaxID=1966355 RepID=UPI002C74561A|nr:BrnA antitoxin family protein [Eoetvoesiella sp.]HWK61599.1 BrnA antitoxin family protein [Eoetvoesiella sp.]
MRPRVRQETEIGHGICSGCSEFPYVPGSTAHVDPCAAGARVWADEDFRRARPAHEVLPAIVGEAMAAEMLRPRGRPRSAAPKLHLNVRLDADVVRAFKEGGPGWQTRMNDVLKAWVRKRGM